MNHEFPMRSIFPPSIFPRTELSSRPSRHQSSIDWEDDEPEPSHALQRLNPLTSPFSNGQHGLQAREYSPSTGITRPPYYATQEGTSQSPAQQFHSRERALQQRNKQSRTERVSGPKENYERDYKSDTAMAYAVKSARYPVLYEKIKAPAAAKKALKKWRKDTGVAVTDETQGVPTLGCGNQARIEGTRRQDGSESSTAGGNATPRSTDGGTQSEDPTDDTIRPRRTSSDGNASRTSPGNGELGESTPSSSLAVARSTAPTIPLPPQHMTFSDPVLEKTKRGNRIVVTCILAKSYPNFHLECEYTYIDKSDRKNSSQTDTRFSFATITTRENTWVVAFEQTGYNEAFIKAMVGDEEYTRLKSSGGPVEGHPKDTGVAAGVGKKVDIPGEFDLGGIWCVADGFYKMKVFVPASTYRQDYL